MGYEDVGDSRDVRPDLGCGLVLEWGFFGGRIGWGVYPRVLEYPGTVLRSVWTAVNA